MRRKLQKALCVGAAITTFEWTQSADAAAQKTVVAWGGDYYSQAKTFSTPLAIRTLPYKQTYATGNGHSLYVQADGTVLAWGNNLNGQANVPEGLADVVGVSAGASHSVAWTGNGTVVAWGDNSQGQCATYGINNVAQVATHPNGNHSVARKLDGTVVAWGANNLGQASPPPGLNNVAEVAAGIHFSMARKSDNSVVVWGSNGQYQAPPYLSAKRIAAGGYHAMAIRAYDDVVQVWGDNSYGQTTLPVVPLYASHLAGGYYHSGAAQMAQGGANLISWGGAFSGPTAYPSPGSVGPVSFLTAGASSCTAVLANGTIVGWGGNAYGERVPPPGMEQIVKVASWGDHTLGLKMDGTVVGWGFNLYGQAAPATGLADVKELAAGQYHSLALTSGGQVVGWGSNLYGQLTSLPSSLVTTIAAGGNHSLAVSQGVVYCAGQNTYGQAPPTYHPNGIAKVAAGLHHSLALTYTKEVIAWGRNQSGQCNVPAGLSNVKAIRGSSTSSLALKEDGTLVPWGQPQSGFPQNNSGFVAIAAGPNNYAALKNDGTVVVWGSPSDGQTTVPNGLKAGSVAVGSRHVVAASPLATVATSCRPDRIVISWTYPFENSMAVDSVRIDRATSQNGPFSELVTLTRVVGADSVGQFHVDGPQGIMPGTTYYYRIEFNLLLPGGSFQTGERITVHSNVASASTCSPPTVGPMDVAFVLDNTSSMGNAFENMKMAVGSVLADIATASGNDYRLALVTSDDDIVNVRQNFASNNAVDFTTELNNVTLFNGGGDPESTDECLKTVINALNGFSPFRTGTNVRKVIVLITDALPGGFGSFFDEENHPAILETIRNQAATKCIKINSILVDTWSPSNFAVPEPNEALPIMEAYANETCGWFTQTDDDGSFIGDAILQSVYTPGPCVCP